MDQLDIAIHQTAHNFDSGQLGQDGLPALAKLMGIGQQVLRNKVNPNNETNHLSVRELLGMMLNANDFQALCVINAECGFKQPQRSVVESKDLLASLLHAEAEHGDVSRALADAIADGKITEREKAGLIKEIRESIAAKESLLQSVMDSQ